MVELGGAGEREFASCNSSDPLQALHTPVGVAGVHFFPSSADDVQGLFGDAVNICCKTIGVAFSGVDELEFKGGGSCHLFRDKCKGGSRELWLIEP